MDEKRGPADAILPHSPTVGHVAGAAGTCCGLSAWAEWFAVPWLYPDRHGPVPHIDFAFQALALFATCVIAAAAIPLWPGRLTWPWRLAYALAPATYVAFQLSRLAGF